MSWQSPSQQNKPRGPTQAGLYRRALSKDQVTNTSKEGFDPRKHKVSFKFHMLKAMRSLTNLIEVVVNGHVEDPAFISGFNDMEEGEYRMFESGHVCEVLGQRIKIDGPGSETGLWLVPVTDPTKAVKQTRVTVNTPSRLEFVCVDTGYSENRLEVRTRYSEGSTLLNNVRVITSPFTLTMA